MKNEIGRKLTSLTIMAIMFAGGMAIGVPSFVPEAASDLSVTEGMLTVSSTTIQGPAILEVVVNDPDNSDTTGDVSALVVEFGGTDYDMTQATNGKWYFYVVDASSALAMDDDSTPGGMEYGILCAEGLGKEESLTKLIVGRTIDIYANVMSQHSAGWSNATALGEGSCQDADGMVGTLDDTAGTTSRENMTDAILTGAPSLSDPDGDGANLGQRGHGLNASGYGTWPYIVSVEFTDDNEVAYGSDAINVVFGNTDDETSISLANQNPADRAQVHLTFSDPALNIDPTGTDKWVFDLADNGGSASATTVEFASNGTTNTAMTAAELGELGCVSNCALSADGVSYLVTGAAATTQVTMTETGSNTGVFESFDLNGVGQFKTRADVGGDSNTVFQYGDNYVDMIITYNDASITMDAGAGAWAPATTATISLNDPDLNRNPTSAETLKVQDETARIPSIVMGTGGLTLAGGSNAKLQPGATNGTTGVNIGEGGPGTEGASNYQLVVYNTTDHSERLRIVHQAEYGNTAAATSTWINVTTGHSRADLLALGGTVVLSYDVTGPAEEMSSTDINVYVTDNGDNSTNTKIESIDVNTSGNVKAGVFDLDGGSGYGDLVSSDITAQGNQPWGTALAGTSLVTVNFEFTHAAGKDMAATSDYAIAADFCNFDQNNGSLTHNCIYRLEAVETGEDTGIFEGTVEYITLNNSSNSGTRSNSGEHNGNDHEVESLLGYVKGDALTVVLQDSVSGSDSVRVVYNDTDAFQVATKIGDQLETSTYTGVISLDADDYGPDDIATITITDPDLNQDSALRDTYQNSSTTFQMTITSSGSTVEQYPFAAAMTIIETGANTGEFVGTFKVPNYKGADMELIYYESRDAAGSAVQYYDTATISSATGSIALDRSVYPVPFASGDLASGDSTAGGNSETGSVVAWITVTDPDETNDTLTTNANSSAGTILVKVGTTTCATAGSQVATSAGTSAAELGPLAETAIGSQAYEVSFTMAKPIDCGSNVTVASGNILQVQYVDTADDAGVTSTVYDSATFDLRTGSLSVDKDVYVMGSDVVITLTDPDLNLDSTSSESYAMSLFEWDSSASSSRLLNSAEFTSNPSKIEETGDDTGVFQTVTTLPTSQVNSTTVEYGEGVTLTYNDVGLSGENNVADDNSDIEAYFSISNFGALIELDKAVYAWTDTVYVTITAPDHNNNSAAEETIGTNALPLQASSRKGQMCTTSGSKYTVAAETGPDTGVFTAEIALLGYSLATATINPDGVDNTQACSQTDSTAGQLLTKGQTDGISVSYEYTNNVVVVASASILFNIGEVGFDVSSAPTGGSAVFTVTDADINVNSAVVNTFEVDIYSDSDSGGLTATMVETNEDTGVFEATVNFTDGGATSGSNLRVSEGDTVTAEYSDTTLPEPYTDSDSLTIAATLTIGTAFPPLERAPAANARVVDSFGSSVAEVSVDQQVQIAADVSNGQSKEQAFAYLVQIQDGNGVTVSLAWITGSLTAGQSMSPALSWTPRASGSYTATVFVWESVDNPTALSPTVSVNIDVV